VHFSYYVSLDGVLALKSSLIDVIASQASTFTMEATIYLHVMYGLRVLFFGAHSQSEPFLCFDVNVLSLVQLAVLEVLAAKCHSVEGG
jgi:hypothetical protein